MAGRDFAEEQFAEIEYELNRDRAGVLGRYGRRVEAAIARCEALLAELDAADATALDAYHAQRLVALEAVEGLCLQREVLNLLDHTRVHEIYPVPPLIETPGQT